MGILIINIMMKALTLLGLAVATMGMGL